MEKVVTAGGAIEALLFQEIGAAPEQSSPERDAQTGVIADYLAAFIRGASATLVDRGVPVEGVCDGAQMEGAVEQWRPSGVGEDKINTREKVRAHLSAKPSIEYAACVPHNFLHIKTLVADNTVATGSFNFSNSARGNAENVLIIRDGAMAAAYRAYIQSLTARYRAH